MVIFLKNNFPRFDYCIPKKPTLLSFGGTIHDFGLENLLNDLSILFMGVSEISCLDLISNYSKRSIIDYRDFEGKNMAQIAIINKSFGVARSIIGRVPQMINERTDRGKSLLCKHPKD